MTDKPQTPDLTITRFGAVKFKLYVIYAGDGDLPRAEKVSEFFLKQLSIDEISYLDSFSKDHYSNNFYEFGPMANILSAPQDLNTVTILCNSTFCSGHSLLFRRYLIRNIKIHFERFSKLHPYFAFGELAKGFGDIPYFSSYLLLLRTPPVNFLSRYISQGTTINDLRSCIPREFRYSVFRWVSYRPCLKGWHSAIKDRAITRHNYKRKLISIYYEYKLSEVLFANKEINVVNLSNSGIAKFFDRMYQLEIKRRTRYGRKK